MRITTLSGGVGGARFIRGLRHHLDRVAGAPGEHEITVIGNTGDDITLWGLRICPDLDTLLYTLGGGIHEGQGWGRAEESHRIQAELAAYGAQPQWFGLGDLDLGTHIVRSQWLGQGLSLSEVTARLADRWALPGQGLRLLPMSDDPVETHVVVADADADGGLRAIHFQEWWVRFQASVPASRFVAVGMDRATAAPGVLDAIRGADLVILPPSNPVVSIGIILGVPGVRDALRGTAAPVVGVSPIVGGAPVRGHADACLSAIGVEATAGAVGDLFADFLDGWLVDPGDAPAGGATRTKAGLRLTPWDRPLLMPDVESATDLAGGALDLALSLRNG